MQKAGHIILVVLVAGASAGMIHGTINMFFANPYLEMAIEVENQALFSSGLAIDTPEFRAEYESYREWQRGGQVVASVVLGMAFGALFGVVFMLSNRALPGKSNLAKAVMLAGIMWFALYVVPFVKYPPTPPAVGDPETITLRIILYVVLVAASGVCAIGSAKVYSYLTRHLAARHAALAGISCYAILTAGMCIALPSNPEPVINQEILDGFKTASIAGVTGFWLSLGAIFGMLGAIRPLQIQSR